MLYIIIVNYKGAKDTVACLSSIWNSNYSEYRIVVVDNNSQDDSVENIFDYCKRRDISVQKVTEDEDNSGIISNYKVYIIESSHNGGFAYANNIAIKFAMEFNDCESVLLLNNDTEIMPDTISQLVNTKTDKVNACVTGRIFYYGTNILWYDGGGFNKTRGKSWHINAGKPVDRGLDLGLHSVEFVSFCMILIPITVVNLVGLLDESYYMYNEDTDWCYRAKGKDVSLIYNPSAVLYHKVGASSGGKVSCFSAYWTYRNEFVFNKKRRDKLKYVSIALIVLSRPLIAFRWLLRGKSQLAWISLKTVRYAF